MRALDLFCGAGGMSMGLHLAGFRMYGVDKAPQPRYPFALHVNDEAHGRSGDALEIAAALLSGAALQFRHPGRGYESLALGDFSLIHASPPCQLNCAYRRRGDGVGDSYEDLIEETREALEATGRPYVIENVEGARDKLRNPVRYCGSSFGLDVRRHRLFESNVPLEAPPCDHSWQTPRFPPASNRTNLRWTVEVGVRRIPLAVQQQAMGIGWMKLRELSEAIPPAYGEHIGQQAMAYLMKQESAA